MTFNPTITPTNAGHTAGLLNRIAVIDCAKCHVLFAVTADHDTSLRSTGAEFVCPSGHTLAYNGGRTAEQVANERTVLLAVELATVTAERDHTERLHRAAVGKNTILKRRISHGLCPCCQAAFPDAAAHLAAEHPGYGTAIEGAP